MMSKDSCRGTHRAHLVQVRSQPPELEQLVLLQPPGQLEVVKVIKVVDRIPQSLVILLLDQQVIVRIVDSLDVVLLDSDQVLLDERYVVVVLALEHADHTGVIDSGRERGQQIGQEGRLLLQIEG